MRSHSACAVHAPATMGQANARALSALERDKQVEGTTCRLTIFNTNDPEESHLQACLGRPCSRQDHGIESADYSVERRSLRLGGSTALPENPRAHQR